VADYMIVTYHISHYEG